MNKCLNLLLILFVAVLISGCGTKYARPDRCVCEEVASAGQEEQAQEPAEEASQLSDEMAAALSDEAPVPEPLEGIKPDNNREMSDEMATALSDSAIIAQALENAEENENNEIKIDFEKIAKKGLFDFNSDVISKDSYEGLDAVAEFLNAHPYVTLKVEGHTDSIGNAKYNQNLSERRAESVKKYLVKKGIDANRITTEGAGASKPIADNSTAEGRAQNRRTEMIFKMK